MTSTPLQPATPKRVQKMASSQNVNHLLNFTLPPRHARPPVNLPRRSRKTGTQQGVWNKERFVNAQYRFVMNPTGDYTVHFADPDMYFVFLVSSNISQLKSVKWYDGPRNTQEDSGPAEASSSSSSFGDIFDTAPRAGSMMRMRLVQRPSITTLALPRSHSWPSDLLPPHQAPFHFLHDVFTFSKFMLATPAYLVSDLSKELDVLATERRILAGMNDSLGMFFVDDADQKVRHQIAKAAALDSPLLKEQIDKALRDQLEIEERVAFHDRHRKEEAARVDSTDVPEEFLALKSAETTRMPTPVAANGAPRSTSAQNRNTLGHRQRRNVNPPPPSTSTYYYYQAASGLPLFLHPLDIKILLSHFKSYPSFPDAITILVESFAEGTVNDDLRKRCKYLAHMPDGADVVFIEADLSGVVGAEGLKNFEGALKMRTSRRKEKGRKDDRARMRAEGREKEREQAHHSSAWGEPYSSLNFPTPPSFEDYESPPENPTSVALPPPTPGAWGARSFASTLHSAPTNGDQARSQRREVVEDWDVDAAWHELERNAGGRKKRGTRLVVLGSGGGARRR
ncbi:hypothetical protein DXG03_008393 [Asterophora parasitica]|uniref:Uncharacterized protein n=1 Tax=Asterophora parasitica TaxID=117018 RepID=A0A9P7KGB4_9AGAR|nr:hypothetical protein DXG03_008393 [Asterophora parasitica]